jgi:hypothetical protein
MNARKRLYFSMKIEIRGLRPNAPRLGAQKFEKSDLRAFPVLPISPIEHSIRAAIGFWRHFARAARHWWML